MLISTYYCTSKSQLESSIGCCMRHCSTLPTLCSRSLPRVTTAAAGASPAADRVSGAAVLQCCSAAVTALYARINRGRRGRCPHHLWSGLGLHHRPRQWRGGGFAIIIFHVLKRLIDHDKSLECIQMYFQGRPLHFSMDGGSSLVYCLGVK